MGRPAERRTRKSQTRLETTPFLSDSLLLATRNAHNASDVLHPQGSGSSSIAVRPAGIVKRCDEILQGIVPGSKTELTFGTGRGKSFGIDRQPASNFLWEYSRKNG